MKALVTLEMMFKVLRGLCLDFLQHDSSRYIHVGEVSGFFPTLNLEAMINTKQTKICPLFRSFKSAFFNSTFMKDLKLGRRQDMHDMTSFEEVTLNAMIISRIGNLSIALAFLKMLLVNIVMLRISAWTLIDFLTSWMGAYSMVGAYSRGGRLYDCFNSRKF